MFFLFLSILCRGQEPMAAGKPAAVNNPTLTLFVITGSDWCMNCKRLEKKVLSEPAFIESMKKNGIEIRIIDFPQRKKLETGILKYNQSIADNYHFNGVYPTLILAKNDSKQYHLFFYGNQGWYEFSSFILEQKAKMNE